MQILNIRVSRSMVDVTSYGDAQARYIPGEQTLTCCVRLARPMLPGELLTVDHIQEVDGAPSVLINGRLIVREVNGLDAQCRSIGAVEVREASVEDIIRHRVRKIRGEES